MWQILLVGQQFLQSFEYLSHSSLTVLSAETNQMLRDFLSAYCSNYSTL